MEAKLPIGNLTEERLKEILDDLAGHPAYEAISWVIPNAWGSRRV